MNKNVFMNTETLQLIVTDIAPSGEREVAVIRPEEVFFDSERLSAY
jgi:hypothetical protein